MQESLDLASLDLAAGAEQGFELQLLHPVTGAQLPMYLQLMGTDCRVYREKMHAKLKERREQLACGALQTRELIDDETEAADLLAVVTTGWRGDFTLDGQPLAYSPEACRKLYKRFQWMRAQVDAAVTDRANFLPRSALNSPPTPSTSSN